MTSAASQQTARRIDHFYARADRWRDLASIAARWAGGIADREAVETALAELSLQEEFHAFPGGRLMAALRDRLDIDRDSAQPFAALARRISAAVVTGDY